MRAVISWRCQVVSVPDVDAPEYTEDEKRRLSENLHEAITLVHCGALSGRPLLGALLFDLHRALFHDVRGHAGRPRGRGFGSEVLRFGLRYSSPRDRVADELEQMFRRLRAAVSAAETQRDDDAYELSALKVALWGHTEVIRIHPFEDGNGRSSRLLLDVLLVRFGLRPVSFDVVRAEYIAALEAAFEGDDGPLVDLVIRLQSDALP